MSRFAVLVLLAALLGVATPAIAAPAAPKELPFDVFRIAGPTPSATAAAFALDRFRRPLPAAYIVTSASFADALAVAPDAARNDGVILFADRDRVPAETRDALEKLVPSRVWIIGGEGAISGAVEDEIARITSTAPRRIAGADRFATAAAVSARFRALPVEYDALFVASGTGFADALGGGAAAASEPEVPLLLTAPDALPATTAAEIGRLQPATVFLLGGTAAVSDAVATAIAGLGPTVVRLAGSDRYATSAHVAMTVFGRGATEVVVATGAGFVDALVAGPLGLPVLLVPPPDAVPVTLTDAIARLGADVITIIGGTSSVSDAQAGTLAAAR